MATSYLTWNKLNNLDDEIFHCINQLKVYKKRNNIDSIYEQLLYINKYLNIIFWRDLSNEQKIKIKLFNNSASYSINEELIGLQTVKIMQYSPQRSLSIPVADTPACNIIDNSTQDIPSPLSATVSPQ